MSIPKNNNGHMEIKHILTHKEKLTIRKNKNREDYQKRGLNKSLAIERGKRKKEFEQILEQEEIETRKEEQEKQNREEKVRERKKQLKG